MESHFRNWRNTSEFPDAWARPVCEWLASRWGLRAGSVSIWIRGSSRGGSGHALGKSRVVCTIARRGKWRRNWAYHGMRHDNQYIARTPLESFVFLAAHELHHCSAESVQWTRDLQARGGRWRQSMEFQTQRRANEAMLDFRVEAKTFLRAYRKSLAKNRRKVSQIVKAKAVKDSPEFRADAAEKKSELWLAKARKAERMARKWQSKANRIRGAMRRAAAGR